MKNGKIKNIQGHSNCHISLYKQAGQEMNDIAVSHCFYAQTNIKEEKQDLLCACVWCKANKELG